MKPALAAEPPIDVSRFEAGAFDPTTFDHPAHVRVAWCYLRECEPAEAARRFSEGLRALTLRLGVPEKYHDTITWFFMFVIAERYAAAPHADWETFRRRNADLFRGGDLLRRHYSGERLQLPMARRQFLLPDRVPSL